MSAARRAFTAFALVWPLAFTAGCASTTLPDAHPAAGRAVVVTPVALPDGHPAITNAFEPPPALDRSGRAPRRLDVEQLRASLLASTGFTWVAARRVSDPDSKSGTTLLPDADMLEALAATLGRPDYVSSTSESINPAVTFSKLASDAARSACHAAIKADVAAATTGPLLHFVGGTSAAPRRILREAGPKDTAAANPDAIRKNIAYLVLRFWGRTVQPESHDLDALFHLFDRASTLAAGTDANGTKRPHSAPADGWRAVCIAMATDPQFLTY